MLCWTGASEGPKSSDLHLDRLQIAHYSTTFVAATLTAFGSEAFQVPHTFSPRKHVSARHRNDLEARVQSVYYRQSQKKQESKDKLLND